MTATLILEFAALGLLLFCSAFFSSAETALFSLNPIQVHHIHRRNARAAQRIRALLALPTHLLSTVLIGNTLVNISAAGLSYAIAESCYPDRGEVISIPVITLLLLVFGEVAPKRLAMTSPERLACAYAPVLRVLVRILAPVRFVLEAVTGFFEKHIRPSKEVLSEDEFLTVVEMGEEEGVLDEEERTMVDGIIRLEETQASDVMTPRVDLVGIDLEDSLEECKQTAMSVTFRYLPIYRETLDNPEGFLDVPRFLLSGDQDLEAAMIPPYFVPETVPLDTLLAAFQRENKRVAFVADEYGGTAGLVTRGDILEEIVSDVENEYGDEKPDIQQVGSDRWLVDGSVSLEELNYELDLELEAEGADRIAGWVNAQAERIPRTGESVEAQGCRVRVERVRRNRIILVHLEKVPNWTPEKEEVL